MMPLNATIVFFRIMVVTLMMFLVACSTTPSYRTTTTLLQSSSDHPNFLIIISDDQRYDTMQYMPHTQALIFDRGVTFSKAYVTTSQCCPSRASILTGMYAHNHGVYNNSMPLDKITIIQRLSEAGYFTGVIGKYLNSYPEDVADPPRSEFNVWNVFPSGRSTAAYYDPDININGKVEHTRGYQTYLLRDRALEFIELAHEVNAPFILMFAPYAPHYPALPAPGDEELYANLPPYRPPSFNEADMSDKPDWLATSPFADEFTEDEIVSFDERRLNEIRALKPLDVAVADMIAKLDSLDMLDNTVIIYISDNGFFWGEHRLIRGKIFAYEPSTHVPFAIRYPPLISSPSVSDDIVANIDIGPTIYELAGLPIPEEVDGLSLVPILKNDPSQNWRSHLLLEGWPVRVALVVSAPNYQAVHTGRYVYIETDGDRSEFYDLETDPFEISSQVDNPDHADIVAVLRNMLAEERKSIPPVPDLLNTNSDQGD
jgi:N-acetylglucosamine-6-sulfatase